MIEDPRAMGNRAPRFMTDAELLQHFGISRRALQRLRLLNGFPGKDALVGKTDHKAVDRFFDARAGIGDLGMDGQENWS